MKKLSLILAGALLLGGISFASPVVKQAPVNKTEKSSKSAKSKTSSKKTVKKTSAKKGAAAPAK